MPNNTTPEQYVIFALAAIAMLTTVIVALVRLWRTMNARRVRVRYVGGPAFRVPLDRRPRPTFYVSPRLAERFAEAEANLHAAYAMADELERAPVIDWAAVRRDILAEPEE